MQTNILNLEKLSDDEIMVHILPMVDRVRANFNYINLEEGMLSNFLIEEIQKSRKTYKGDIRYSEYMKSKLINFYIHQIQLGLSYSDKEKQILDNYINKYFKKLETSDEVSKFKNFDKKFYVFGNDFGIRPLVYAQAQRRKGEIANKAGIKEIRLHDFRHSCASLLVNNKAPITVVSSFLGHSNTTETLKTYSHLFKGALNETMDVINNLKK